MSNVQKLREKYPYIVKWGQLMGSYDYYIDMQVEIAEEESAPTNATFKRSEYSGDRPNEWTTIDDIANPMTRVQLGLPRLEEKNV